MKIKITENEEKFEPFDVTLTIENEDEARLLWHIFNDATLTDVIFDGLMGHGGETIYIRPAVSGLGRHSEVMGILDYISEKVKITKQEDEE